MGRSYVFLVHGQGPAVGDFGAKLSQNSTTTSSQIIIRNNNIHNIKCWTNEVPGKCRNLQLALVRYQNLCRDYMSTMTLSFASSSHDLFVQLLLKITRS